MFVDDFMTADPITVNARASLVTAHTLIEQHRIHHLPVLDESSRLVGIITDRDVRSAVGYDAQLGEKLAVSEVMTADPMTIPVDAALDTALIAICRNRFGALPVVRKGQLVGIITKLDLLRGFHQVLGLDEEGTRVEIALPDTRADLAAAFEALRNCDARIVSAIVSRMRRDSGEPALYLRIAGRNTHSVEQHLRNAALVVLEPEHA